MRRMVLLVPLFAALTACASNGWDASPVGDSDDEDTCYQVHEWSSEGFTTTTKALGTYCPEGPVNNTKESK